MLMSCLPRSSVLTNGEEPSLKKKTTQSTPIPSLPDDLLLSCFARVSRFYYPILSRVSKSFRSLVASPEVYETRSLSGRTESCLYVCLRFPCDPNPRWFTLCRRPNRTLTDHNHSLLVSIPSSHFPPLQSSSLVALGPNIYEIGGVLNDAPSCNVSILDCRSHTWHQAPSMRVERDYPAANAIDGKIYVAGGCKKDSNSSNWVEVFDPKTRIWKPVSSPGAEMCGSDIIVSTEIDGKAYMYGSKGVAYNPKDGTREPVEWNMCKGWAWYSHCVIDNVLYCFDDRVFKWFDTNARIWRILKGLIGLPKFASTSVVKLADFGGKMAVLWDKHVCYCSSYRENKIWCAVIAVERCSESEEIWGTVEWFDVVFSVPESCKFVRVLSVTL